MNYDNSLTKYIQQFSSDNASMNDYLYVFSNSTISFDYGISTFTNKEINFKNIINNQEINILINDDEIRNLDSNRTNWKMNFKNLQLKPSIPIFGNSFYKPNYYSKFDLTNQHLFKNYDLQLNYNESNEYELYHEYLYQTKGIDISDRISFITEDGSYLDQDFKVIKPSSESNLKLNDYAYIAIRYWTTFKNNKKEYITLVKRQNKWFSPKYNEYIQKLDPSFNEKKIEYLFNHNLQMIINPYENNGGKINSNTKQSFGIKRVIDEIDGNEKILEDWNDGYLITCSQYYGNCYFWWNFWCWS